MQSKWVDKDAEDAVARYGVAGVSSDLAIRTYSARLIGSDPSLVLHGGGNTSVKSRVRDILGEGVEVLHIKGSGWDLGTIEPPGHPAVRMSGLLRLRSLKALSDEEMVNVQRTNLLDASAPNPSVETLLHAFLPHKFIDHTHADAGLAVVDQPDAEERVREIFGEEVGVVPYIMPGFALAKLAAEVYEKNPRVKGLMLVRHGVFSFGETARESYERMIELVDRCEKAVRTLSRRVSVVGTEFDLKKAFAGFRELAPELRGALALPTGSGGEPWKRFVFDFRSSEMILRFCERSDLADVSSRGPITPDHIIRTKQKPMILKDLSGIEKAVSDYRKGYHDYFARVSAALKVRRVELDGTPRVVLIPGVGMVGVGTSSEAARIASDIYEHTVVVIEAAESYGRYQPLPENDLFSMEYWSLEQAKLGKGKALPLEGQVCLITGAGSGIGAQTARVFSKAGAQLVLWDIVEERLDEVRRSLAHPARSHIESVDVTQQEKILEALGHAVDMFGGLDIVISNAGKAWTSEMSECSREMLRESFELNFYAHQYLAAGAVGIMKRQGLGGCLLFNASKSAFNPGPNFGPYSLPKAAVVALMKQYAVEGGARGIRSNAVNADRVRTRLFDEGMLERRAASRGVSVDEYLSGNLLQREVTAQDVAEAFLNLALSYKTTGAVLPVDGGNIAAAPR